MPAFTEHKLPEQQALELYDFIIKGLAKPTRSGER